jgi:hypothetical protein
MGLSLSSACSNLRGLPTATPGTRPVKPQFRSDHFHQPHFLPKDSIPHRYLVFAFRLQAFPSSSVVVPRRSSARAPLDSFGLRVKLI